MCEMLQLSFMQNFGYQIHRTLRINLPKIQLVVYTFHNKFCGNIQCKVTTTLKDTKAGIKSLLIVKHGYAIFTQKKHRVAV